ncbi:hypothetical protein DQ354_17620 [Arthrobacter sp. AQ5-06]|nr:hypothetical protein DQ354_17620 [Arthrobacter sp. AQ5-06]
MLLRHEPKFGFKAAESQLTGIGIESHFCRGLVVMIHRSGFRCLRAAEALVQSLEWSARHVYTGQGGLLKVWLTPSL